MFLTVMLLQKYKLQFVVYSGINILFLATLGSRRLKALNQYR